MINTIEINSKFYHVVRSSDTITMDSKTGRKSWTGHILKDSDGYYLTSSWSNFNNKTKNTSVEQWSAPYPVTIKNAGKSNETTLEEQANLEFNSMVKKELDKRASDRPLPMLAWKFQDRSKYITYPAYAQPKLNGMRMLFDGTTGWSRGGKDIIPECIQHLTQSFANEHFGFILDGELILPNNVLLQETMKAAKKYRKGVSDQLMYCVYDIVDTTGTSTFEERSATLKSIVHRLNNPLIQFVDTREVHDDAMIYFWHKKWTQQGYEGTMIRNKDGVYAINQRSNDLQKYKDMVDSEFKIVDVIEGDGSFKGCAIFVCENEQGSRFNCTPEGNTELRKEYFTNRLDHINKWLTIRYQELSNDLVPLFPVGVSIRDEEDF